MTIPAGQPASLTFMQPTPLAPQRYRLLFAAMCLFLPVATARAEDPPMRVLLRDGLYAEEVTRDAEAAANQYEQVITRYAEQRELAATALFRLAEVRRKQDRKDDAIQLYQRFLTEFSDSATQAKLARENLVTLGAQPPAATTPPTDPEAAELARLDGLSKSSPDIIRDPGTLFNAVKAGWSKVVRYLLSKGSHPYAGDVLRVAAGMGNLEIVKQLTDNDTAVPETVAAQAIQRAIRDDRQTVLEYLLKKGFKPGMTNGNYGQFQGAIPTIIKVVLDGRLKGAEILLQPDPARPKPLRWPRGSWPTTRKSKISR